MNQMSKKIISILFTKKSNRHRSFGDYEGVEELVKEPTMSTCELRSSDGESQNCCNGVNLELQ